MNYLLHLDGRYLFNRRVPDDLKEYGNRLYVRASLKTGSRKEALQRVSVQNARLEDYWQQLIQSGKKHTPDSWKIFNKQMRLVRFVDFSEQNDR